MVEPAVSRVFEVVVLEAAKAGPVATQQATNRDKGRRETCMRIVPFKLKKFNIYEK